MEALMGVERSLLQRAPALPCASDRRGRRLTCCRRGVVVWACGVVAASAREWPPSGHWGWPGTWVKRSYACGLDVSRWMRWWMRVGVLRGAVVRAACGPPGTTVGRRLGWDYSSRHVQYWMVCPLSWTKTVSYGTTDAHAPPPVPLSWTQTDADVPSIPMCSALYPEHCARMHSSMHRKLLRVAVTGSLAALNGWRPVCLRSMWCTVHSKYAALDMSVFAEG